MICSLCQQIADTSKPFSVENKCIQSALEIITKHFALLETCINEKENTVKTLQIRNEKLMKAIELLQRKQQQDSHIYTVEDPPKRRKSSVLNCESEFDKLSVCSDGSFAEGLSPRLNTALNSEDLDISSNSPSGAEVVAETEKIMSPRVFRTPKEFNKRVRRLKLTGLKNEQRTFSKHSNISNEFQSKDKTILKKYEHISSKLTTNTTPSKENIKLKQTTLHFKVPKKKTISVKDFEELPTTSRAAQGANIRVLNEKSSNLYNMTSCQQLESPKDNNRVKVLTTSNKLNDSKVSDLNKSTNFELRLDYSPKNDDVLASEELFPSSSPKQKIVPSCILLSPPTPEIVFLDDTLNENSNKSVESMLSFTKDNDDSWFAPKADKKVHKSTEQIFPIGKSCLDNGNTSLLPMPDDTIENIKKEKLNESITFNNFDSYSDDLIRQVESELLTENNPPPKKPSIRERFNIDCTHCQNYIDFLDGQLSDKQIEEHLRKCTRHKERDVLRNLTPDDFWNPLLQSFAEDDPRNEVLIDNRVGIKKRYK